MQICLGLFYANMLRLYSYFLCYCFLRFFNMVRLNKNCMQTSIFPIDETLTATVTLEIMAKKGYPTLPRLLEQEAYHQTHFSFIARTSILAWVLLLHMWHSLCILSQDEILVFQIKFWIYYFFKYFSKFLNISISEEIWKNIVLIMNFRYWLTYFTYII